MPGKQTLPMIYETGDQAWNALTRAGVSMTARLIVILRAAGYQRAEISQAMQQAPGTQDYTDKQVNGIINSCWQIWRVLQLWPHSRIAQCLLELRVLTLAVTATARDLDALGRVVKNMATTARDTPTERPARTTAGPSGGLRDRLRSRKQADSTRLAADSLPAESTIATPTGALSQPAGSE